VQQVTSKQPPSKKKLFFKKMTKQLTFSKWLKAYPIILEKYRDLPESYLRFMHYQSTTRGAK